MSEDTPPDLPEASNESFALSRPFPKFFDFESLPFANRMQTKTNRKNTFFMANTNLQKTPLKSGALCCETGKLFQQDHLPGFPKLSGLDRINIHPRRHRLTKLIGRVPMDRPVSGILICIN